MHGWIRFISMQNHYNLINREEEREMVGLCLEEGIGMIPWSPLARGRLARPSEGSQQTTRAQSDKFGQSLYTATEAADRKVIDQVSRIAKERGVPQSQVALAWLLHKPVVTAPIFGATQFQHLEDALAALELKLSPEEI